MGSSDVTDSTYISWPKSAVAAGGMTRIRDSPIDSDGRCTRSAVESGSMRMTTAMVRTSSPAQTTKGSQKPCPASMSSAMYRLPPTTGPASWPTARDASSQPIARAMWSTATERMTSTVAATSANEEAAPWKKRSGRHVKTKPAASNWYAGTTISTSSMAYVPSASGSTTPAPNRSTAEAANGAASTLPALMLATITPTHEARDERKVEVHTQHHEAPREPHERVEVAALLPHERRALRRVARAGLRLHRAEERAAHSGACSAERVARPAMSL
eukprot:5091576-Prymnesium_polylepis.2